MNSSREVRKPVLFTISCIWAISFGLIKYNLATLDANFVAFIRLLFAVVTLLPFLRFKALSRPSSIKLLCIGAIQYGLMYMLVIRSYQYLEAYQVALFTAFTPIYIVLADNLYIRYFNLRNIIAAIIAFIGAAVLYFKGSLINDGLLTGFILVQIADLCFALGQIFYRYSGVDDDSSSYALVFIGGACFSGIFAVSSDFINTVTLVTARQWMILMIIGIFASGIGNYIWNVCVKKAPIGLIAVMNNLKLPLGILASIIIYNESADLHRLLISFGFISAALVIVNKTNSAKT